MVISWLEFLIYSVDVPGDVLDDLRVHIIAVGLRKSLIVFQEYQVLVEHPVPLGPAEYRIIFL